MWHARWKSENGLVLSHFLGELGENPHNFWLISYNLQDLGSQSVNSSRATYFFNKFLRGGKVFILVLSLFIGCGGFPLFAQASVFSFLESFLGSSIQKETSLTASLGNSQTMILLQPASNPDPNPSKGGGDITVIGDTALLPDVGIFGTIADVPAVSSIDQISIYVVRDGDTLSQIAKMFGVSVNTILWANDIPRGSSIRPGQTLVILPVSGVRYTVKSGDTIASIAKKFKGDPEEIRRFNDITDSQLAVADEIIIPDGESQVVTPVQTPRNGLRGAGGPSFSGYYIRPVPGRLTQGLHGYNGVDFAGVPGTPIVAAASGVVIVSRPYGWNGGYGEYVVLDHPNGTQTLYAHMSSVIVSAGSPVVQGQVVGYVGATGRATGPHLHFEVRGAKNPFANG